MELRVLGACGSWPAPGEATSGYLVTVSDFTLCVDLGTGTLSRLQETMSPLDLRAVVITHAHPDHFVDLYSLFYLRFFHPEPLPAIRLFCPPGFFDSISCFAPRARAREMRRTFDLHEVQPGAVFEVGPFTIRTREMRHRPATIGIRLTDGVTTFAYTADTGPTDEITKLAEGADLFLSDATWLERDARAPNHLSAGEAGSYARRAAVGSLLLTHLWPAVEANEARDRAAAEFDGSIHVARSGLNLRIDGA